MAAQQAEGPRAIESALLDFQQFPGRYIVALRQPPLLFASVRQVLQLAGERSLQDAGPPPSRVLVQAARFFVRVALLQPSADHYAIFGLPRDCDAGLIKERYRQMMRLLHPDFAGAGRDTWPSDAATRINQAYDVLSLPERRRAYDESLSGPPVAAPQGKAAPRRESPQRADGAPARHAVAQDPRSILRWLAVAFGALGGLALLAAWILGAQDDGESLVQRATTRVRASLQPIALPPAPVVPPTEAAVAVLTPVATPSAAPAAASSTGVPADQGTGASPLEAAIAAPVVAPTQAAQADEPPRKSDAMPAAAAAQIAPVPASTPASDAGEPQKLPAVLPVARTLPAVAAAPRSAVSGPTMAEVHPLLSRLLDQIAAGWGDNVVDELDNGSARRDAGAQALARQIDELAEGARPLKVTGVEFRGEPRDGRLLVKGRIQLQGRDPSTPPRQLGIVAEFTQRNGAPALTRLAPAQ